MKKIFLSLSIIFLFIFILMPRSKAYSSHPLDEIKSFEIWANTRSDGTVDFEYKIDWLVLDSSSEGGVTWVKIGVPNRYCNEITYSSTDIKKAYYDAIDGECYIRCNLAREYMQGEHINIHFKFHQSRMFTFMDDPNDGTELTTFKYIPGWFEDIEVDKLIIHWNKNNVRFWNAKIAVDDPEDSTWLTWTFNNLSQGERVEVNVSYETSVFPTIDRSKTYVGPTDDRGKYAFFIVVGIIIAIICIIYAISTASGRRSYYCSRGFYPVGRRYFFRPYYYGISREGKKTVSPYIHSGSSGHSGGGHSCACACACACAGGGRAGCSKKDFYKGKIDINEFIEKD